MKTKQTQKHGDKCGLSFLVLRQLPSSQVTAGPTSVTSSCLGYVVLDTPLPSYSLLSTFIPCSLRGWRQSLSFIGQDNLFTHYPLFSEREWELPYQW